MREIAVADLDAPDVLALIAAHLAGMQENSPPESVHALAADGLRRAGVTVWTLRDDGVLAGIAALSRLDARAGEIKSMRVAPDFLGRGVGRELLRHLMAAARAEGVTRLWLETGSSDDFLPARRLYASEGFEECGPFAGYRLDPHSTFMTRPL